MNLATSIKSDIICQYEHKPTIKQEGEIICITASYGEEEADIIIIHCKDTNSTLSLQASDLLDVIAEHNVKKVIR